MAVRKKKGGRQSESGTTRSGEGYDYVRCRLCGRALKLITWTHLHFKHGLGIDGAVRDYMTEFGLRFVTAREVIERITEKHVKWTRDLVKQAIRKEHASGRPLWYNAVANRNLGLLGAGQTRFGSWTRALRAAGLDPEAIRPPERCPSANEVETMIKDRVKRGESLSWDLIDSSYQHAARKHFGSWRQALQACGLSSDAGWRVKRWTPKRVQETIRSMAKRGEPLNSDAVARKNSSIVQSARKVYGSWEAAIRSCGLDYEKIRLLRPWSPERVRARILDRRAKGQPINAAAVQREESLLYMMAVKLCGSWPKALEASNIPPESVYVLQAWTHERVRAKIRDRARHGKSLRRADVLREDSPLVHAAIHRFKKWNRAIDACGL